MKVLHVAVFNPLSTNVWQADGFEELGCEVLRYDYRARVKKLGMEGRDNELVRLCYNEEPDIILFSKCNKMRVEVVKACREIGKTVLWYMDGPNNWDTEVIDKAKNSDYVFCSVAGCVKEAAKFCSNSYRLQGGFNSKVHYPMDVPKTRDVAFIGDMRAERKPFLEAYKFNVVTGVYNEDHSRVVSGTKINLSFTRGFGVSNRIYKLMAAKGFVLTQPWEDMEKDFAIGEDLEVFNNEYEMKEKIEYYLDHENERASIAYNGYNRVQQYDNINYAKTILERVKND